MLKIDTKLGFSQNLDQVSAKAYNILYIENGLKPIPIDIKIKKAS
jgi:hypothetical protein